MNKVITILILFFSMSVFSMDAINFKLENQNSDLIELKSFKGKTIVLEWFNHDCPFVKKHYQSKNMQTIQKKFVEKGIVWLTIVSSAKGKQGYLTPSQARERIKQDQINSTSFLLDPEGVVGRLYKAKTTPHMFIIDQNFKVVFNGPIDDISSTSIDDIPKSKNYVVEIIDKMELGEKVKFKKIKPYGCSIKY